MAKKAETYEAMAERLQSIADKLADGNLPLEEMIKLYEEGAKLAAKCREMLEGLQGAAGRDRKTKRGERR